MRIVRYLAGLLLVSGCAATGVLQPAEVVLVGEIHGNPTHHAGQAEFARNIQPSAIVFEMIAIADGPKLTAARRDGAARSDQQDLLDWANSGWPDYAFYAQIMDAAPDATIYGAALPRADVRRSVSEGPVAVFGPDSAQFGLDRPLPPEEQADREAMQAAVHCNALPENLLPGFVGAQRLRDAALARATLTALEETGGPVLVIAGNGHVRTDYGIAVYLKTARPDLRIDAVVQVEGEASAPSASRIIRSPAIERPDPCAAFRAG